MPPPDPSVLLLRPSGISYTPRIRGIGADRDDSENDSPLSVHVDGTAMHPGNLDLTQYLRAVRWIGCSFTAAMRFSPGPQHSEAARLPQGSCVEPYTQPQIASAQNNICTRTYQVMSAIRITVREEARNLTLASEERGRSQRKELRCPLVLSPQSTFSHDPFTKSRYL